MSRASDTLGTPPALPEDTLFLHTDGTALSPRTIVYSASDLTAAAYCEFALMRRLDAKLGRDVEVPPDDDPMLARAGTLGTAFELRTLETLKLGRDVIEFEQSFARFPEQAAATSSALAEKKDVLYQATFFDGRLLGFADFIMLNADGVYEVYDTKLARKARVTALLQLAAYTDQLERLGVAHGENVHLILGDGRTSTHRVRDILPVYRRRRARLQQLIDERQAEAGVTQWGDQRYSACGRCVVCAPEVEAHRDLLLVAGMRGSQRARLFEAGIVSIGQLATSSGPVDGISATALDGLRAQARVQVTSTTSMTGKPAVEVFRASALAAIPAPDTGDIFFDFEGDPLYSESADGTIDWGLDYLFGMVDAEERFTPFWAHTYAQERTALIDFLAFVAQRRAAHPGMHIYHYASYERSHLLSLAARHGVGENEVDDLLRDNVLVDLYPIVKKALRVGSHSYSIKKLEPLYMNVGRDKDGVTNGADSVTAYADARQLFDDGHPELGQAGLDAIASYNTYDCVSTLRLRDWLLELAAAHSVAPQTARDATLDIPVPTEPSPVYTALAAHVADVPRDSRSADDTAIALASAAIDYHRREAKQFWQEHFDRLQRPVEEWADTRGVLVISRVTVETDWTLSGKQTKARRLLHVEGTLAPGSALGPGAHPYLVYGEDANPPIAARRSPGAKASSAGDVVEVTATGWRVLEYLEPDAPRHDFLPVALTPGAPPRATPQPEAIEEWGYRVLDALPRLLPDAALDVLRRVPPRGTVFAGEPIHAIEKSLLSLDHSYLAVQGPPGTGKTYTGSRVIAALVARGWRIGVVAQSHTTVENMLRAVAAAGVAPARIGKKPKDSHDPSSPWTGLTSSTLPTFLAQTGGRVLGGTAWTFANGGTIPRQSLDLLVIDEAGQFSLASTIASAVSAKRLLLLGDPQQLPQVSQGSHPEPVDVSALGWLSEGHDVLPPEFGYFLAESWRMHPAVTAPVSRLSYEGKLESRAAERMLAGVEPGLHPVALAHTGNATSSPEEAERVVELVRSLQGRAWTIDDSTRPLGQDDVIVVAPYNAQVELLAHALAAAGLGDVPVGTVDRFQGREAAIAIVSLAASSAAEVPRGLEFLLLANRLNVAISRAQWAAYLIYSPGLLDTLPSNAAGLAQLSAFMELVGA